MRKLRVIAFEYQSDAKTGRAGKSMKNWLYNFIRVFFIRLPNLHLHLDCLIN